MVERFDAEYDEDIGIIYRQSPKGGHVRFSAYATLEEKLDEALKALDEIASDDEPADVEGLMYLAREAARSIREGGKV